MTGLGLKQLAANVAATLGRQVCSGLLQLATLAIIARVYGPEGNGAYTLALLLPTMLATLLNMGMAPANVYFLGTSKVTSLQAWRVSLQASAWIAVLGGLMGGAAIYWRAAQWFPGVPIKMLWLALGMFPVIFVTGAISSLFQGLQEFKRFNAVLLLQPILMLCLVGFLTLLGVRDIFYILLSYFFSLVVTQITAYRLLQDAMQSHAGPFMPSYAKQMLNYGYKAHLSNILAFVNNRADMFLLGYFLGPVAVGIYAIAVNLTEKLWLFSGAVSTVLLPRLSQLSGHEDKRNQLTPLIARWSFWITFCASLILLLLGPFLVDLLFGKEFKDAYMVIVLLVPGVVMGACSMVLANDMAARGRPDLNLATSWISVSINVIGNIILIPRYGVHGAAVATSFAYTINFFMRMAMHSHFTGVRFYRNVVMGIEDLTLIRGAFNSLRG